MATVTTVNPSALKSVLGAVSKGAGALSAIFDSTTESINMVDAFVTNASQKQKDRYKVERKEYRENLKLEYAERVSAAAIRVSEFRKQSPEHERLFDEALADINDIFED